MQNSNVKQADGHVDELIDEVVDDPDINSNERHFLHKIRGREHSSRRDVRKVLKIYQRSHFHQGQ